MIEINLSNLEPNTSPTSPFALLGAPPGVTPVTVGGAAVVAGVVVCGILVIVDFAVYSFALFAADAGLLS